MKSDKVSKYISYYSNTGKLGIDVDDAKSLLGIERKLRHWAEDVCNGLVEVDENGVAYRISSSYAELNKWKIPNQQTRALKKLDEIMNKYPHLIAYHQTDPRGCSLYIIPKKLLGDKDISAYYSSIGLAVSV